MCSLGYTKGLGVVKVAEKKPKTGWRVFGISSGGLLKSTYSAVPTWTPTKLKKGVAKADAAPSIYNDNGLYIFSSKQEALRQRGSADAIAKVAFWGNTVEHSNGYRAEFAQILEVHTFPTEESKTLRCKSCGNWHYKTVKVAPKKIHADYTKKHGLKLNPKRKVVKKNAKASAKVRKSR